MTCAVTGVSGFVGRQIKRLLQDAGWQVAGWSRRPGPGVSFRLGTAVDPRCFEQTRGLVHCAYDFEPRNRDDIWQVNVQGSEKLFRAARQAGVDRIVFISSLSAFEGCRSHYGQAKLEIEQAARATGAQVIRPGLIYGDEAGGMFGRLAAQVRSSRLIPIITGGRQTQYLVHADDLGALVQGCLEGRTDHVEPIPIAHPQPWALQEILRQIARALEKPITFLPLPWKAAWAGLKMLEVLGARTSFRSDSLLGMVYQNPSPDFELVRSLGFGCRPFQVTPSMVLSADV